MANDAKKVSELGVTNSLSQTDRVVVLTNPTGSRAVQTITLANLAGSFRLANNVPATANASGTAGTIVYDSSYIYVCVANNTWKRAALSTW